jgi:hypothetical protein
MATITLKRRKPTAPAVEKPTPAPTPPKAKRISWTAWQRILFAKCADVPWNQFWVVWAAGTGTAPRYRYETEGPAISEATRLANKNPGVLFRVLRVELSREFLVPVPEGERLETDGAPAPEVTA